MRASPAEINMKIAEAIAQRGTCDRLQVGAIITRDSRVISTGYNGNVAGAQHCDHDGFVKSAGGVGYIETGCQTAVHAEANALVFAARHGVAVQGAELWSTHQPCLACANLIINSGIARVFFKHPYRLFDGLLALQHAGLQVFKVTNSYEAVSLVDMKR